MKYSKLLLTAVFSLAFAGVAFAGPGGNNGGPGFSSLWKVVSGVITPTNSSWAIEGTFSGVTATPAGSDGQVQFNNGGSQGGADVNYNSGTSALSAVQLNATGADITNLTGASLNVTSAASFESTVAATGATTALLGSPVKTIAGNYTIGLDDIGYLIQIDSGATVSVTIPNSGSVAFPAGSEVYLSPIGAGTGTILTGASVTTQSFNTWFSIQPNSAAVLKKVDGNDTWSIFGNLAE